MTKLTVLTSCSSCQDISLSSIKIKKPYTAIDNIYIFDIAYGENAFALQTSACVIPYSYHVFDNKSFQFDVHTCDSRLKQLLLNVNNYILGKVRRYNCALLNDKLFLNYVKEVRTEPNCEYRIRLRNINTNNISVFDKNNGLIDITTLQTFDKVICLFQIQKLIVQKETYFFQASVVQIKKINTPLLVLRECLIQDSEDNMDNSISCGQEKPNLDFPDVVVERKEQKTNKTMSMCLAQIKQGVSLNSKLHNEVTKVKVENSCNSSHKKSLEVFSFCPPSLSDILQARTKLKPVK